jgi:hypothetical protein
MLWRLVTGLPQMDFFLVDSVFMVLPSESSSTFNVSSSLAKSMFSTD